MVIAACHKTVDKLGCCWRIEVGITWGDQGRPGRLHRSEVAECSVWAHSLGLEFPFCQNTNKLEESALLTKLSSKVLQKVCLLTNFVSLLTNYNTASLHYLFTTFIKGGQSLPMAEIFVYLYNQTLFCVKAPTELKCRRQLFEEHEIKAKGSGLQTAVLSRLSYDHVNILPQTGDTYCLMPSPVYSASSAFAFAVFHSNHPHLICSLWPGKLSLN